ncbi:alanine racemase [Paucibacter sp. AS339]|uniref:alanine racemase n=1 Tax=Paucibacter hankyongi TaxID=3133434 RepID=UPI0030A6FCCE
MKLSREFLDHVAASHGPSFYLLDSCRFQDNFKRLTSAFRVHYPQTTIAYSYKTNYVPRYCELVSQLGGYAEVVSSMEMMLALKLKVPASKVFFNGPYKEHEHVQSLLAAGGTVNVDSWEELQRIACSADTHPGAPFKLGLRCNFEVQDGVHSRFGFDVESQEFLDAVALIDNHPKLKLSGLHCHFATRSLDCWVNRTKGMIAVIDRHFRHRLADLAHVSLGGGMYGHMPSELKAQFPVTIPEFEDYAAAAALPFARYFEETGSAHRPTLIIEPGTALVADAMKYVCQVNSVKLVRGRTVVSLTGSSYNINPNPNRKNVPIECFPTPGATARTQMIGAYFGGYTCIEGDYLYKEFSGTLAVGDFIAFDDVGSYSVVMKPPFILPNVAIVEPLTDGHSYKLIKRREVFDDIFQTYTFE